MGIRADLLSGMIWAPRALKSGNYHFSRLSEPLYPTQAGTLNSVRPRDYIKAGDRIRTDDVQLGKLGPALADLALKACVCSILA